METLIFVWVVGFLFELGFEKTAFTDSTRRNPTGYVLTCLFAWPVLIGMNLGIKFRG